MSTLAEIDAEEPVAQRLAGRPCDDRKLATSACPGQWGAVLAPAGIVLVSWWMWCCARA
jgi:hypothetical protein